MAPRSSYRGSARAPGPVRREAGFSPERCLGIGQRLDRVDGNVPTIDVERVRPVPANEGGAGDLSTALPDLQPVDPDTLTFESETCGRAVERLSPGHRLGHVQAPEAEQPPVVAVETDVACEGAVDLVSLDGKDVAETLRGKRCQSKPSIDLFPAIGPRKTDGEPAVHRHR